MIWESDLRYVSAAVLVMVGTGMNIATLMPVPTASADSMMEACQERDQEIAEEMDNKMVQAMVLLISFVIYHNLVVKRTIARANGANPGTTTNSSSPQQQQQIPIAFATLVSNNEIQADAIQDDGLDPREEERSLLLDAAILLEEVQVEVAQNETVVP